MSGTEYKLKEAIELESGIKISSLYYKKASPKHKAFDKKVFPLANYVLNHEKKGYMELLNSMSKEERDKIESVAQELEKEHEKEEKKTYQEFGIAFSEDIIERVEAVFKRGFEDGIFYTNEPDLTFNTIYNELCLRDICNIVTEYLINFIMPSMSSQ